MLANIDYWRNIYSDSKVPTFPSQFSVFVQSWLGTNDARIIEFGCGNGRDSRFFHQMGHSITVSDQVICDELQKFAMARHNFAAVETSIVDAVESLRYVVDFSEPVVLYSRFFQHAITEADQLIMLSSLAKVLHKDSTLFFEFRLDGDEDGVKEFGTSHFRRFQSADEFKATLAKAGFECTYSCEGTGYARYKSEDPHVGRFVASPSSSAHLRLVDSTTTEPAVAPVATLRVDDKKWLHGVCSKPTEGLAEIRVNDTHLTYVPLMPTADGQGSKFIFRPAHCLITAMPEDYTVNVILPCKTQIDVEQPSAFGSGNSSLVSQLEQGYRVSAKAGYLFKPPADDANWRKQIIQSYELARQAIAGIDDVSDLFVAYGALLGQVRTGDFIAHDDDFDAGILVDADSPAEAAEHYYRIVGELRDRGYTIATSDSHLGNFHLYLPDMPSVDIFLFFYRESTSELCSYNLAHVCDKDLVLPLQSALLSGETVLVPNQSAELLAATYGDNWRTPDPYFQWNMTPRHDLLKHTYQAASRAVENGEAAPTFNDPWLPQIPEELIDDSAESLSAMDVDTTAMDANTTAIDAAENVGLNSHESNGDLTADVLPRVSVAKEPEPSADVHG